jgi:Na+-translocating ferredoxin:NAD+ oxidoreductase subunit B
MSEDEIYFRFIAWLDKAWWHLPASKHLLPAIRALLRPDEAQLLTGLPFVPTDLEELAALKAIGAQEIGGKLDALAKKGVVWKRKQGSSVLYNLNDAFFIFFQGPFYAIHPDPAAEDMASPLNRYVRDGLMDQLAPTHTKGLRAIPINKTIEDPRTILPYEDVMGLVDSQGFLSVSKCACRQRKRLDPDSAPCDHPEEVCLHFGDLGQYLVDNGLAREITREEAKKILQEAADAGLVHAVSNRQQEPGTICNCCKCSCIFFESYHVLRHDRSHDFSNYRLKTNPETCKACGLCVERCPVEALRLGESAAATNKHGKVAMLDPGRCLGCGVCVHKCPTRSLILEPREEFHDPPQDMRQWMKRLIEDQRRLGH